MKPFLPKSDMPGWREINVAFTTTNHKFLRSARYVDVNNRFETMLVPKSLTLFMWFWWHLTLSNLGYRNSFVVLYFFLILFVSIIIVWYVEIPLPLLDGKASSLTWPGKVTKKNYSMPISMHSLHWLFKHPTTFDPWSDLLT